MQTANLARLLLALFLLVLVPGFVVARPADEGAAADSDAQTKALVERRLARDDLAAFHRIDVDVRAGVVTLSGAVRTRQTHDAVLREVQKIPGVLVVQERIKIQPTP